MTDARLMARCVINLQSCLCRLMLMEEVKARAAQAPLVNRQRVDPLDSSGHTAWKVSSYSRCISTVCTFLPGSLWTDWVCWGAADVEHAHKGTQVVLVCSTAAVGGGETPPPEEKSCGSVEASGLS